MSSSNNDNNVNESLKNSANECMSKNPKFADLEKKLRDIEKILLSFVDENSKLVEKKITKNYQYEIDGSPDGSERKSTRIKNLPGWGYPLQAELFGGSTLSIDWKGGGYTQYTVYVCKNR